MEEKSNPTIFLGRRLIHSQIEQLPHSLAHHVPPQILAQTSLTTQF